MKIRIVKVIALTLFISLAVGLSGAMKTGNSTVRAVGDLAVDWGVPEGNPIFVISNFAPGQAESKTVILDNNASSSRPVGVRGLKISESGSLASVLNISISWNGIGIYDGTLNEFFSESSGPDGIPLKNLNPGENANLDFRVTLNPDAGNAYQDTSLVFDLRIGISVNVPDQCLEMDFSGDPIFGTDGPDNIKGTNKNDLIFAFEGNDRIQSSNGNDCVVGGPGNDFIDGSNGNDWLSGSGGNDKIIGSNGNDYISGGPGSDKMEGGNGSDSLNGDDGDDNLAGGNGNDSLIGGDGTDVITGNLGADLCTAEKVKSCEL